MVSIALLYEVIEDEVQKCGLIHIIRIDWYILIACGMQLQRGEARENWSHAVMSGDRE